MEMQDRFGNTVEDIIRKSHKSVLADNIKNFIKALFPPRLTEEEILDIIIGQYTAMEMTSCLRDEFVARSKKLAHALSNQVQKGESICDKCSEICKATHPRSSCTLFKPPQEACSCPEPKKYTQWGGCIYCGKEINPLPIQKEIEALGDYIVGNSPLQLIYNIMSMWSKLNEVIQALNSLRRK